MRRGNELAEILNGGDNLSLRAAVMAREEAVLLVKPLAANGAHISSLSQPQDDGLSKGVAVLDAL